MNKFSETRVVTNTEKPLHHRFVHSAENIAIVSENVAEDPNVSIPRRSQEWVLQKQAVDGNFSNKIVGRYVTKQNFRIWCSENPQVIEEMPLHLEKVTI